MSKFRFIKNALIGGEISPTALGRTDLPSYPFSCETLLNMIPMLSGGAYRRPGTFHSLTSDVGATRLIEFIRSRESVSVIALHSNGTYADGFFGFSHGAVSSTVSMPSNLITGGGFPTSLTQKELSEVQFVQSADVMYLAHPKIKPYKINYSGPAAFSGTQFDYDYTGTRFRDGYPYLAARSDVTITPSDESGTGITLSATATVGGAAYAYFKPGHVGSPIKLLHGSTMGCARIKTVAANGQTATADVEVNFGATSGSLALYESAWSDYRGWPRTVAFYQDRLVYGGTANNPDTIWFSKTSEYYTMSVPNPAAAAPTGSDAFHRTLVSRQVNQIQWMIEGETLVIGSAGDEWICSTLSDGSFGPNTATVLGHLLTRSSSFGSAYRQAIRVGSSIFFVTSSGFELKELTFNDSEQAYTADSIQVLYDEHPKRYEAGTGPAPYSATTARDFTSLAWDSSRSTAWGTDVNGNLFGCVRDRRLSVLAWHRHELGGGGKVVSMCVTPNHLYGYNDVWLCVERTVNAATVYHIERIVGGNVSEPDAYTLPIISVAAPRAFADCSVYVTNNYASAETYPIELAVNHLQGASVVLTAASTKGLFALPARTVALLSDATTYGVTLTETLPNYDGEKYYFAIGYNFSSVVEPVRFDAGSQIGTAQGARKRIHDLTVRFYKTIGCKYGPDASSLFTIIFRASSTPLNKSADLFTGDKKLSFSGSYDRDGYIYLLQDQPLPFTVCAVVAEGVTYD